MEFLILGFLTGLSLILAIGAQNIFVIEQGLKRQYVFLVCLICSCSDLILIFIAILLFINSSLSLSNRVVAMPNHQNSIIQVSTGSLNGFIIGLTSIYTMPFVFLLQSLKYNKEKTVQFMGLAFLLYSSMQFISFSYSKLISINTIVPSLIVTLPVIIGFLLGKKIRSFISEKLFKKLFYLMLLLMSGIILINAFL